MKQKYYYQTWWFRCGCVLLVLAFFLGYRVHVQRIKAEFDATLKERAKIAREMHDTVIQGCTGISVLLEALASQHGSAMKENILFQHARTQIVATVDEARDMVSNLRNADKKSIWLVSLRRSRARPHRPSAFLWLTQATHRRVWSQTWPGMKC